MLTPEYSEGNDETVSVWEGTKNRYSLYHDKRRSQYQMELSNGRSQKPKQRDKYNNNKTPLSQKQIN